jgi:phenylacetate-CoA ligase
MKPVAYSWREISKLAQKYSHYYAELYKGLDIGKLSLSELPIIDLAGFWKANQIHDNKLLTQPAKEGIWFKSGGTSGQPKYSFFTGEEWQSFTGAFGEGMSQWSLRPNDKIANLFYAGSLYASFLFIKDSIEKASVPVVHLPLGGGTEIAQIMQACQEFNANVLAGVPTTILKIAEEMQANNFDTQNVQRILYGGESVFDDQRNTLKQIFPNAEVLSIGYASVDGGLLGYADITCEHNEHRMFDDYTIIELVDEETGEIIVDQNQPGKVILTNLTRKAMPIIRYPAGDRAQWVESKDKKNRKFKILGRSEDSARVGPTSLFYDDAYFFLEKTLGQGSIQAFQLILNHYSEKDELIIRVAVLPQFQKNSEWVVEKIFSCRPMLFDAYSKKQIHKPKVEFVKLSEIESNTRTGKIRRVIDNRKF